MRNKLSKSYSFFCIRLFVLDENVYSVSVEENGKTYTVENKAGVGLSLIHISADSRHIVPLCRNADRTADSYSGAACQLISRLRYTQDLYKRQP